MVPPSHPISLRFRVLSPTGDKLPVEDFRLRTSGLPRKRHSGRSPISIRGRGSQRAGGPPSERSAAPSRGRPRPPSVPEAAFLHWVVHSFVGLFIYGKKSGQNTHSGGFAATSDIPPPTQATILYRHLNHRTKHDCRGNVWQWWGRSLRRHKRQQQTAANTNRPTPPQGENAGTRYQERPDFKTFR